MSYLLTAVNRCLSAIGETPVNSLQSGLPDAADAQRAVEEVAQEVLSSGWNSNTSYGLTLTPDNEGCIAVPTDYLRVDSSGTDAHVAVTVRADPDTKVRKLWRTKERTFTFDRPILVDVVHSFGIDEIPFHLQNYISARAARVFQERVLGSTSLDGFTRRAEAEAWAKALDAEAEIADHNCLAESPYMRAVTARNNPLRWR